MKTRFLHPVGGRDLLFRAHPLRATPPLHATPSAFTLIELMAATTVLSVVLLMMVGMQDQMSRAWSNANRRTEATREARAAALLMRADLAGLTFRGNTRNSSYDAFSALCTSNGIPFLYCDGRNADPSGLTVPYRQTNSAYLFGLSTQKNRGTNAQDIALVGYYVASSSNTNVNGFVITNYNLYRYFVPASNAASNLSAWFQSKSASALFQPSTNDEILARNCCNLRITFFGDPGKGVTNGLNFTNAMSTVDPYRANKVQVEWSVYPEDSAQKITLTNWGSSTNIQRYARSFEFRADIPRN
jgi:prepilin-type N-terminal cleavage/methylation domain-containing protein